MVALKAKGNFRQPPHLDWGSGLPVLLEPKEGGSVYFVTCALEDFPVKVGYAGDIARRMRGLQTSMPWPIILIAHMGGSYDDERMIHLGLYKARLRGEWYARTPELVEYVSRIRSINFDTIHMHRIADKGIEFM